MSTSSSSIQQHSSSTTYEATKAQEWNAAQADKIHWERDAAYRNQAYRQLHHQNGLMGRFQIRLLEGADLQRSYWSALALGPVKLLGLSKAHGPVSSFVSVSLTTTSTTNTNTKALGSAKKPPASFVSPVIPQDSNPVWSNCQFELALPKGVFQDGQPIQLQLRVDEDATAVEHLMPSAPDRLLGFGSLDLTSLCLGQTLEGQPQVGVLDAWVPIAMPGEDPPPSQPQPDGFASTSSSWQQKGDDPLKKPSKDASSMNKVVGRVRVLVSYQPIGMEPQPKDIVALEAFARQNPQTATCRPILPPYLPLHVLQTSGPWLLVDYHLESNNNQNQQQHHHHHLDHQKACLRLHRNSVFVIERKNLLDETLDLAMLPADALMSTSLGRSTKELIKPLWVAGSQLLMPALLTTKLLWMAVRTTALASLTGVHAVTATMWNEGSLSLTQREDDPRRTAPESRNHRFV